MADDSGSEDRLYRDADLAGFYDTDNGWRQDQQYCLDLAKDARSVLDLGCGTGQLAAALGPGRSVVGVDPARAMLDIARRRPGGDAVEWIEADARTLRMDRRFDLVLLTGHVFQVFLTEDDQRAALACIAQHLAPGGRFVFDSRSRERKEWLEWQPAESERLLNHADHGQMRAWNTAAMDEATGVVTYETHYQSLTDQRHWSASSQIVFTDKMHLDRLLDEAGLIVDQWLGDWAGGPLDATSDEMIPIGRRRADMA